MRSAPLARLVVVRTAVPVGGDAGAVDQSEASVGRPPTPTVHAVVAGPVGAVLTGRSGRRRAGVANATGRMGPWPVGQASGSTSKICGFERPGTALIGAAGTHRRRPHRRAFWGRSNPRAARRYNRRFSTLAHSRMNVGVPTEHWPGEARVALVPDSVARLTKAGVTVTIERGAGVRAGFTDAAYEKAGATLADAAAVFGGADLLCKVQKPTTAEVASMRRGSHLVSLLQPSTSADAIADLDAHEITAFALELVPRITRAQSMDVLSSQATVAGYKAVLVGASAMMKFLPMLTTAAGTIVPSKCCVLGAGVAGLQAIATARRLGAVVSGFDIRAAAAEQIRSLGATVVAHDLIAADSETAGGYAREQSAEQQAAIQTALRAHLAGMDLVITTAQVPGRAAPRLISAETVATMMPGSVIVDLAAESGGNCEGTKAGETVEVHGVTIIGPVNLPATMPQHASQMLSRNILTFIQHLLNAEGALHIDRADEITGAMIVTGRKAS